MQVFKFGGASVKDAEAVKRIPQILEEFNDNLCIVISAIDKTTNNLERLLDLYYNGSDELISHFSAIKKFHFKIIEGLFVKGHTIYNDVEEVFKKLEEKITSVFSGNYDFEYDQIVPFGEILSTYIINEYLRSVNISSEWFDIREVLITNNKHRDATVNFSMSEKLIKGKIQFNRSKVFVTQGFIGATKDGVSTTLGREGSDYTASVLAYILNAKKVIVWKDVDGIMTADPKWRSRVEVLPELSYKEAIELAFYGAKVIHPKTIKPLQNKNIPLFVKSFLNPKGKGTKIWNDVSIYIKHPIYIQKDNQVLLSISPKDFSFIAEDNLSTIFSVISSSSIKCNLMQNSAVSFSMCIDYNQDKFNLAYNELKRKFNVLYNPNVELITIRHYNDNAVAEIIKNRNVLLEQRSRNTIQFVLS